MVFIKKIVLILVFFLLISSGCGVPKDAQNKVSSLQTQVASLQSKVQKLDTERQQLKAERDALQEEVERLKRTYELRNHISSISYKIIEAMETKNLEALKGYTTDNLEVTETGFAYYHEGLGKREFSYPDGDISRLRERGFGFYEDGFVIYIEYYKDGVYNDQFNMYYIEENGKWKLQEIGRDI